MAKKCKCKRIANKHSFGDIINKISGDPTKSDNSNTGIWGLTKGGQELLGGIATGVVSQTSDLITGGKESNVGNAVMSLGSVLPFPYNLAAQAAGIAVNGLFGSKMNQENINNIQGNTNALLNFQTNASDYDSLAANINSMPKISSFTKDDIGSDGLFSHKAENKFNELQKEANYAQNYANNAIKNNAENIATNNLALMQANYSAYGGPFNMKYSGVMSPFGNQFNQGGFKKTLLKDFNNDINIIGTGGTHEANPMEGVQIGVDPQGVPNLVEEGEVIWNDYVFSNRLKLPKSIRNKHKLRGITFADAAKEIQKESEERPFDPISKRGLNASMQELAMSQEQIRMKKENNKYAKGGKLGNLYQGDGEQSNYLWYTDKKTNNNLTPDIMMLNPDGSVNWDATYNNNSDFMKYRNYYIRNWDKESFKPIKNAYLKRLSEANGNRDFTNLTLDQFKQLTQDQKWGAAHELYNQSIYDVFYPKVLKGKLPSNEITLIDPKSIQIEAETPEKTPEGIQPIQDNWMRYAPLGSVLSKDKLSYDQADLLETAIRNSRREIGYRPIGDYMPYEPFDIQHPINQLNAQYAASRRAINNTSGGNRGAALAGILASDYNYGNSLGDLAIKAKEYNLAQKQKALDFNRATNMTNSQMGLDVDKFNASSLMQQAAMFPQLAQMRLDIENTNRIENIARMNQFFTNLGNIGKDEFNKEQLRWVTEKGGIKGIGANEFSAANGGKIKRKKKGVTI